MLHGQACVVVCRPGFLMTSGEDHKALSAKMSTANPFHSQRRPP